MGEGRINPATGASEAEYFAHYRDEVYDGRVGMGLATIVRTARYGFGFTGDALVDYLRRAVAEMVDEGARPHHFGPSEDGFCTPPHETGPVSFGANTPQEIVDGVVETWVREGMDDLAWGDFRFSMAEAWEEDEAGEG